MMQSESVNDWLDEDRVRSLAEDLLKPGPAPEQISNERIFGNSFEGFADPTPEVIPENPATSKALESLSEAQRRASSAGVISPKKESPKPTPTPKTKPQGNPLPLAARLRAFGVWLKEQIPANAYFLCNHRGEIVVDEVDSEKLVKVACTLAHASNRPGSPREGDESSNSLHVKIGPERLMEVIPRHSQFGLVVLGLIVARPLSDDAAASVARALGTALAEPSTSRQ